jgi:hypothetical protein
MVGGLSVDLVDFLLVEMLGVGGCVGFLYIMGN